MNEAIDLFTWAKNKKPKQQKKICLDCGKREVKKKLNRICFHCKHTLKQRFYCG